MEKTPEELICFWKKKFRNLDDWEIKYISDSDIKNQCSHNKRLKHGSIYRYDHDTVINPSPNMNFAKYVLHEILHMAIIAPPTVINKQTREILVQDLTAMLNHYNKI